jgi:outer membrane receptor protein involved in Fe transport
MRGKGLLVVATLVLWAAAAGAQSTTGTISGRVVDPQGLPVPGVTVTANSPNLQGVRETVTSENGDYILTLLPSGTYTVVFELTGFGPQRRTVTLAPTQTLPLEIELGPAALTESVEVVGRSSDVLVQTAQVATNFSQDLLSSLPTNRDYRSVMLMAPSVHPSGPLGAFSVAGSMSYENLFMVNGVTVNENLRGQAQDLVIEDAVQETTVATAGISAEFGRFGGGVINVITKSGGNLFSGSFRDTLTNDNWRALVPRRDGDPFAGDSQLDDVVPTYEYTVGGPVFRDRLWFFHAGRLQTQTFNRQLVRTNVPYVFTDKSKRFEGKLTYSLDGSHRVQGAYTRVARDQLNNTFQPTLSMDRNSLGDRSLPEDLFTLNYTGVLGSALFLEGRYSQRNLTFVGSGSRFQDLQKGTLLVDPAGQRYHADTFCGVCTPEERDNQDFFVKGTYFSSTDAGSHTATFGYDLFNDTRFANNHQSGSDYRFLNAPAIIDGGTVIATMRSGVTEIVWNPIFVETQGNTFKTHSLFLNDSWRMTDRLTANLGVRWDRNDGRNSAGTVVAREAAFSPRLGVVWDPSGTGSWSVTASAAKYVMSLLSSIADQTSPGGNSDLYRFIYRGPDFNVDPAARVSNEEAVQRVFDWFFANGGAALPITGAPTVRGITPQVRDGALESPFAWEYATGVNRTFTRGALRADFIYRNYSNFYLQDTTLANGRAIDDRPFAPAAVRGREYDLSYIRNDEDGILTRRYAGLSVQGQYRMGPRLDVGANYTLSRAWGNVDGENSVSGPLTDGALHYPEYRLQSWNFPDGDLSIDQRHRSRLWVNYTPWGSGLTLGVLQALESGIPYSASNQNSASFNGVDPRPWVGNIGYLTPPTPSQVQYYYTARDAFRLEGQKRTDLAVSYDYGLRLGGARPLDLFVQAQVINLFNQFQLCGCGGSAAFTKGGNLQNQTVDTGIRTAVSHPALYQPFNPFTTTPVEGVHWDKSPTFGRALNRFAYTTPRMLTLAFGLRF